MDEMGWWVEVASQICTHQKFKGRNLRTLHSISYLNLCYCSVLSNKLDAPMLSSIIAALSQEIVPQGNLQDQLLFSSQALYSH